MQHGNLSPCATAKARCVYPNGRRTTTEDSSEIQAILRMRAEVKMRTTVIERLRYPCRPVHPLVTVGPIPREMREIGGRGFCPARPRNELIHHGPCRFADAASIQCRPPRAHHHTTQAQCRRVVHRWTRGH